jgi:hypothetical protein
MDTAWNTAGKYPAAWLYHQGTDYTTGFTPVGYPAATGNGTRFVFVDNPSALGGDATISDSNKGTLASPIANMDSATGALTKMRDSSGIPGGATGDWMCLRKGAVYTNSRMINYLGLNGGPITLTGRTDAANTPIVIAGFDWTASMLPPVPNPASGGARPEIIITPTNNPNGATGIPMWAHINYIANNFAIMGIKFTANAGTSSTYSGCLWIGSPTSYNFILIEDCSIASGGFEDGVIFTDPLDSNICNTIFFRRNILVNNYGQGLLGPIARHFYVEENLFRWNGYVNGTSGISQQAHNFYRGSNTWDNGGNVISYPTESTSNIYAQCGDNDGARAGDSAINNLWVNYPVCMVSFGVQVAGQTATVNNNVFTEGVAPSNYAVGVSIGDGHGPGVSLTIGTSYFQGEYLNKGSISVTNNLLVNNTTSNDNRGVPIYSGMSANASNNIVFNSPNWAITDIAPHAVKTFTWSGGSGYTNSTIVTSASAINATACPGPNNGRNTGTVLVLADRTACGSRNHLWIETSGRPGPGGVGTQDVAGLYFVVGYPVTAFADLTRLAIPLLPWNGGSHTTNIYIPHYSTAFPTTSGAGSQFSADIVVKGGTVISVDQCGSFDQNNNASTYTCNGSGYAVGDTISTTAIGGTFTVTVSSVINNTVGPNEQWPNNTPATNPHPATWLHPERNVTLYTQQVLGISGGTVNNFLDLAQGQSRSSWNSAYTAGSVNDWIRSGFGITGTTPVISPSTLPGGTVGASYGPVSFSATGGTAPYTWSSTGTIPPGLTFNPATATLDGGAPTTTTGSPFTFTISARDSAASPLTGSQQYTVTIAPSVSVGPSVRFVYHKT